MWEEPEIEHSIQWKGIWLRNRSIYEPKTNDELIENNSSG